MNQLLMEGYRALDLTDQNGFFCGKILADLGVDVIKIEPPDGDAAREIGPFYHDLPGSDRSLYWLAYNANKKGITLNIECEDGKEIFKTLVRNADFVIESFSPGYLDSLGLGYAVLSKLNERVILTSITAFGQDGPYRDFKATDIVVMAMGGSMYVNGEENRSPLCFSLPLAYLHASTEAAVGTMIAHYHRGLTGRGQWVDQSAQQSVVGTLHNAFQTWELSKKNLGRSGVHWRLKPEYSAARRSIWRCLDGYVSFAIVGAGLSAKFNLPLMQWMAEEGMCPPAVLEKINWNKIGPDEIPSDLIEIVHDSLAKFFMTHTKAELYEGALKRRVLVYPVADPKDILENPQLISRGFWIELAHPELGGSISYPGPFVKTSEVPLKLQRRAPYAGEHNLEIYTGELGLTNKEISTLKGNGVI